MHRSSDSIASLAAALAKAQMALTNPEKSLTGTLPGNRPDEPGRTFRYAPLSAGLDIVRKVLGQHEIATLQTTVIDQDIQTVSLTTVLVHASGEWIASDWPVCTLSEMATPRRMGAALTYARRYSLFSLVGIAGEDDLDAPDLAGQPAEGAPKAGNGFDQGKVNGSGAAGTLGAFARNRKPWTPPKQALAPEASAALRDRLLGELSSHRGRRHRVGATRARHEEHPEGRRCRHCGGGLCVAYSRAWRGWRKPRALACRGRRESRGSHRTAGPRRAHGGAACQRGARHCDGRAPLCGQTPTQATVVPARSPCPASFGAARGICIASTRGTGVNNAVVWHVDKSALPLSEPRRYRDRAHLKFVASQPCLRCERQPAEPHHLRFVQPRALGRKVSDEYAVPLCRTHHREVHRQGDEAAWWASAGIDALAVAHRLWQHTRLNGAPIQEHIDPLLGAPSVQADKPAPPAGPARS